MYRSFKRLLAASALTLALTSAAAAQDVTLKFGHLANEENIWHKAALKFAEEVSTLSNGTIKVEVFPNEQLGKEMDIINGIQLGTADMTITGESLQNWAPSAALLAVPYAIRDIAHLDAVAGGPIGDKIEAEIIEKAQLRPIAYFARGPRDLTSNREIKTPEDINGLRLRVPNVPLFVAVWDALGAKPTPMAFSEVFTSLQSHTIDAQENPLALIKSASFYEVQKFVNKTEHVQSWIYVVIGEPQFQALTPEQQQAVLEAGKRMQAYERGLFLADEEQLAAELQQKGMTFVDVDKAAFAAKAGEAVKAALNPAILPLYEEIVATK
jgi:TRAP-type transport system periplasmic protein